MLCRYHITFGNKRTTITVDTILSQMMAIKLGETPDTLEAHGAVREWLQEMLEAAGFLIHLSDSCALVHNPADHLDSEEKE